LRNSRRHIWRYRDWVVDSIAQDKGYDRMILEMLAPDEIAPGDMAVQHAGGFLGRNYYLFNRHVWLQDTVEYTGMALLGLTFKCARCHDHKYDPVSQEEYYAFRAFFEPHQVRTDRLPGKTALISGEAPMRAAPGDGLLEGIDLVFDGQPDAPTYLLKRGNEKDPVTDRPIAPAVPAVLGQIKQPIEPVPLPVEAYYPELRPELRQELLDSASRAVHLAEAEEAAARTRLLKAEERLARLEAGAGAENPEAETRPALLHDGFERERPELWQPLSGSWKYMNGHLTQQQVGHFLTLLSRQNLPLNFQARLRYRPTDPGEIHSIGISFDVSDDARDWQAVYTAIPNGRSTVQAFHRRQGAEVYPDAGVVQHPLTLGQEITLDLAVREEWLNVWVNGQFKLAYRLPVARRAGRLALWAHSGTAEFLELRVEELRETTEVVSAVTASNPSPFAMLGRQELTDRWQQARNAAASAQRASRLARLEFRSFDARMAADMARHGIGGQAGAEELASEAARLERLLAAEKAELEFEQAETAVAAARALPADSASAKQQLTEAEAKAASARLALEQARAALQAPGTAYTPIGTAYPAVSSGKRLALARWIADPGNPLTPRVAVNHVWLRHMGAALVPSVFNFGLNGKPPTHPELLDWLAVEFVEQGYSLRALHKLIVTSSTYRMSSSAQELEASSAQQDAENRWYWRANSRRMEAEVLRDTLLVLAGNVSFERGGPELDPAEADSSRRRSLYFRHTPDDKALLLDLFDSANASECYQREESIMPQQALALTNGPFARLQARLIARRVESHYADVRQNPARFVAAAFEHVLNRPPTDHEREMCEQFLTAQPLSAAAAASTEGGLAAQPPRRAPEHLVHVLLNYNEFLVVR
jgi:hypothetical protein